MRAFGGDSLSQPLRRAPFIPDDPAELITIPVIFIALLGRHGVRAPIHQHQHFRDVWFFRFGKRALLELDAQGERRWRHAPELLRERVDPLVDAAVALWAAYIGARNSSEALRNALPHET